MSVPYGNSTRNSEKSGSTEKAAASSSEHAADLAAASSSEHAADLAATSSSEHAADLQKTSKKKRTAKKEENNRGCLFKFPRFQRKRMTSFWSKQAIMLFQNQQRAAIVAARTSKYKHAKTTSVSTSEDHRVALKALGAVEKTFENSCTSRRTVGLQVSGDNASKKSSRVTSTKKTRATTTDCKIAPKSPAVENTFYKNYVRETNTNKELPETSHLNTDLYWKNCKETLTDCIRKLDRLIKVNKMHLLKKEPIVDLLDPSELPEEPSVEQKGEKKETRQKIKSPAKPPVDIVAPLEVQKKLPVQQMLKKKKNQKTKLPPKPIVDLVTPLEGQVPVQQVKKKKKRQKTKLAPKSMVDPLPAPELQADTSVQQNIETSVPSEIVDLIEEMVDQIARSEIAVSPTLPTYESPPVDLIEAMKDLIAHSDITVSPTLPTYESTSVDLIDEMVDMLDRSEIAVSPTLPTYEATSELSPSLPTTFTESIGVLDLLLISESGPDQIVQETEGTSTQDVSYITCEQTFTYQGLIATLQDPKKPFQNKVNALLCAWERLACIANTDTIDVVESFVEKIFRDTLNIVLHGDWSTLPSATKTHFIVTVKRCATAIAPHPSAEKYFSLVHLAEGPWSDPTLNLIITEDKCTLCDDDLIKFCKSESTYLLIMRLEMLISNSGCSSLALRLARIFIRCLKIPTSSLSTGCLPEHKNQIIDYYIALLYRHLKHNALSEMANEVLSRMTLDEGVELIQRHAAQDHEIRLWRNHTKIALLEASYFLEQALQQQESVSNPNLAVLMKTWVTLHRESNNSQVLITENIVKLIQQVDAAPNLYKFCFILIQQLGQDWKPVFIEIFIRSLTNDMNQLEKVKLEGDKKKVKELEISLANDFIKLADILLDNAIISRECVLTAFTLNPTEELLTRIEDIAISCGKLPPKKPSADGSGDDGVCPSCKTDIALISDQREASDITQKTCDSRSEISECDSTTSFPIITSSISDEQSARNNSEKTNTTLPSSNSESFTSSENMVCSKCGNMYGISTVTKNLECIPNCLIDANDLGVSQEVCDDLSVVLNSARWQVLTWSLNGQELMETCKKYMADPEGTRYVITELNHLDVDYDLFKDMPSAEIDEFYGIEEGYEYLLQEEEQPVTPRKYKKKISSVIKSPTKKGRSRKIKSGADDSELATKPRKNKFTKKTIIVDTSDSGSEIPGIRKILTAKKNTKTCKPKIVRRKTKNDSCNMAKETVGGETRAMNTGLLPGESVQCESYSSKSEEDINKVAARFKGLLPKALSENYQSYGKSGESSTHNMYDSTEDCILWSSGTNGYVCVATKNEISSTSPTKRKLLINSQAAAAKKLFKSIVSDKKKPMLPVTVRLPVVVVPLNSDPVGSSNVSHESVEKTLCSSHTDFESPVKETSHSSPLSTICSAISNKSVLTNDERGTTIPVEPPVTMLLLPNEICSHVPELQGSTAQNSSEQRSIPDLIPLSRQPVQNSESSTQTVTSEHSACSVITTVASSSAVCKSPLNMNTLRKFRPLPQTPPVNLGRISMGPKIFLDKNNPKVVLDKLSEVVLSQVNPTKDTIQDLSAQQKAFTNSQSLSQGKLSASLPDVDNNNALDAEKQAVGYRRETSVLMRPLAKRTVLRETLPNYIDSKCTGSSLATGTKETDLEEKVLVQPHSPILRPCSPILRKTKYIRKFNTKSNKLFRQKNLRYECFYPDRDAAPKSHSNQTKGLPMHMTDDEPFDFLGTFSDLRKSPSLDGKFRKRTTGAPKSDVLSTVPGLKNLSFIQPRQTNTIINVVQVSGQAELTSTTTSSQSTSSSIATATQVSSFTSTASTEPSTSSAESSSEHQSSAQSQQPAKLAHTPAQLSRMQLSLVSSRSSPLSTTPAVSTSSSMLNSSPSPSSVPVAVTNVSNIPMTTVRQLPLKSTASSMPTAEHSTKVASARNNAKSQNQRSVMAQSGSATLRQAVPSNSSALSQSSSAIKQPSPQGLPKFQHAFGKPTPAYPSNEATASTSGIPQISATADKALQGVVVNNLPTQRAFAPTLPLLVSGAGNGVITAATPTVLNRPTLNMTTATAVSLSPGLGRQVSTNSIPATATASTRFAPALIAGGIAKPQAEPQLKKEVAKTKVIVQATKSTGTTTTEDLMQGTLVSVSTGTCTSSLSKSATEEKHDESMDSSTQTVNHLPPTNSPQRAIIRRVPITHLPSVIGNPVTAQSTQTSNQLQQPQTISSSPLPSQNTTDNLAEQLLEFEAVLEQVTNTSNKKRKSEANESNEQNSSTRSTMTSTGSSPLVNQTLQLVASSSPTFGGEIFLATKAATTNVRLVHATPSGNIATVTSTVTPSSSSSCNRVPPNIPLVVVTNYSQPVASPSLSITSQSSSSSPSLTPAQGTGSSSSTGKTVKPAAKTQKPKSVKTSALTSSKTTPISKPQPKPQEDEQTVQRIYAILGEYAQQLRNSPDLINKPAPRRRSNPPTNPSQSSKRKKSSPTKMKLIGQGSDMSPSGDDLPGGSEDSSSGIAPGLSDRASPVPHSVEELDDNPSSEPEKAETTESSSSEVSAVAGSSNALSATNIIATSNTLVVANTLTNNVPTTSTAGIAGKPIIVSQVLLGTLQRQQFKGQGAKVLKFITNATNATMLTVPVKTQPGAPSLILQPVSNLNKLPANAQFQNTVRQVKLPVSNMTSQALAVTAQSQVMLSQSTHTVTTNTFSGLAQALNLVDTNKSETLPLLAGSKVANTHIQLTSTLPHASLTECLLTEPPTSDKKCNNQMSPFRKDQSNETERTSLLPYRSTSQGSQTYEAELEKKTKMETTKDHKTAGKVNVCVQSSHREVNKTTHQDQSELDQGSKDKDEESAAKLVVEDNTSVSCVEHVGVSTGNTTMASLLVNRSSVISAGLSSSPLVGNTTSTPKDKDNAMLPVFTNITRLCDLQHYVDLQHSSTEPQCHDMVRQITYDQTNSNATAQFGAGQSSSSVVQSMNDVQSKACSTYMQSSASATNIAQSCSNPQPNQIAQVGVITSHRESTQPPLDVTEACSTSDSPTPSLSGVKRTYSTIRDHTVEYHPYKSKVTKLRVSEQQMADASLEHKLRQEAIEKELRLQKSLSEECEDLGVDEPSTSDLFPEADLLLDPHPGLNFDATAADASCSQHIDSNEQFSCSETRAVDSVTSTFMNCMMHASDAHNTVHVKRKHSRCAMKNISVIKARTFKSDDTNGPIRKLMPCSSREFYSSSSADDTSSPLSEPGQSTTKSTECQERKGFALVRVAQTYGKRSKKCMESKIKVECTRTSADPARPFASVSNASKTVDYSANGTDTSHFLCLSRKDGTDSKESLECEEKPRCSSVGVKRMSHENDCPYPTAKRCKSPSPDVVHADDEEEEEDSNSDENDESQHDEDSASHLLDHHKSGHPVGSSSDSNWSGSSCKSPDSESSPLSMDLKSGSEDCSQQKLARRASLRGKREKNCMCCNGSPEPQKSSRTNKKGSNVKSVLKGHIIIKKSR